MVVGVLALQGDFAEHIQVLQLMNVNTTEVRTVADLEGIAGLVIPGGESTTLNLLLKSTGLDEAIKESSLPMFGTCAGAILLADLGKIDMQIERNAYGRQLDSFHTSLYVEGASIPVAFIRAPKILSVGVGVEILAEHEGNPVLVQQGNSIASTFHTEVTGSTAIHQLLLNTIRT